MSTAMEHWPDLDDLSYEFWREAQLEFAPLPGQLRGCGTLRAYKRHRRNQETPCAECTQANAEASRAQRAALRQLIWGAS